MGRPKKIKVGRKNPANRSLMFDLPAEFYRALEAEMLKHPKNSAQGYSAGSLARFILWEGLVARGANLVEAPFARRGRYSKSERLPTPKSAG